MKTVIYLVVGEKWSGVLQGQAGDVPALIAEIRPDIRCRLVVLASLRGFIRERKNIRRAVPGSVILPMFPGVRNWMWNRLWIVLLSRLFRPAAWICRNPVAAAIAIKTKDYGAAAYKVCYDGRGARAAEITEYSPSDPLASEMQGIESDAVTFSDFRIAVSEKLVDYWKDQYRYAGAEHVVIPCTMSGIFARSTKPTATIEWPFGIQGEDLITIAYAGGSGEWQQSDLLDKSLDYWLSTDSRIQVLFLSKEQPWIRKLLAKFPTQTRCVWLPHEQVPMMLSLCEYGILMRQKTITNRVASPVKFAEYLACGLKVICTDDIGDFSDFLKHESCGHVVGEHNFMSLSFSKIDYQTRQRIRQIAIRNFSKDSSKIRDRYRQLLNCLCDDML